MSQSAWRLQLCGRFELTAPEGHTVEVLNRKVQGLLAVLALNREQGIERSELAAILWPDLPVANRSNNLRQTLNRARQAIGAEAFDSSRTHCRFADRFVLQTDLSPIETGPQPSFMPGSAGDWFEGIRGGAGSHGRSSEPLIHSFVHLLDWFSDHDPARMLGLMRENLGMSLGLTGQDRQRLLKRPVNDRGLQGWHAFFSAHQLMSKGNYAQASAVLRQVMQVAESGRDYLLGVQASAQLCISAMMRSDFAEADAFAATCDTLARQSSDSSLLPTALQIQAMVLLNAGRYREGIPMLERAEQQYADSLDSVIIQALRAHYLATYGFTKEADRCLREPRKVLKDTGHALLHIICSLVDAKVLATDVDPRDLVEKLKQLTKLTEAYEDNKLVVISYEELAKALLRVGETGLAKERASAARKLRKEIEMAYTPWDQVRLSART